MTALFTLYFTSYKQRFFKNLRFIIYLKNIYSKSFIAPLNFSGKCHIIHTEFPLSLYNCLSWRSLYTDGPHAFFQLHSTPLYECAMFCLVFSLFPVDDHLSFANTNITKVNNFVCAYIFLSECLWERSLQLEFMS